MLRVQELAIDALQDRIRKAHSFACAAQSLIDGEGDIAEVNQLLQKSISEITEASVWSIALQQDNRKGAN